ncbi:hypothetical protein JOD54_002183 [Actinokineospora baliensis]|uniref:phage tail tube protein n=1 Tax=Actinokineospora baliensis TaxID=547056 RepID=UPI00195B160F|nr:hypothetical protein [Actinokineospora baliensis]MBM7771979.1 hypothetical protein [Actinokineospora baliensis]
MALNDDAVFTAAKGYILTAPVGTAAPTPTAIDSFNPNTGLSPWISIGHTSREDLPEFGFDGGETEVRGTWQNEALKSVTTEAAVDFVTFSLHQFDEEALSLYYGVTNSSSTTGEFSVAAASTSATERALLIVIVDGPTSIGFYARKAAIRREDAIELATDEFARLPLRATFLKDGANPLFSWISLDTDVNPAP